MFLASRRSILSQFQFPPPLAALKSAAIEPRFLSEVWPGALGLTAASSRVVRVIQSNNVSLRISAGVAAMWNLLLIRIGTASTVLLGDQRSMGIVRMHVQRSNGKLSACQRVAILQGDCGAAICENLAGVESERIAAWVGPDKAWMERDHAEGLKCLPQEFLPLIRTWHLCGRGKSCATEVIAARGWEIGCSGTPGISEGAVPGPGGKQHFTSDAKARQLEECYILIGRYLPFKDGEKPRSPRVDRTSSRRLQGP